MIDLANSTKNLSVNSVALSEVTFKKWGGGNYINIQRKKSQWKLEISTTVNRLQFKEKAKKM